MNNYNDRTVGEQIQNGVFVSLWLIWWPFGRLFRFIHWFISSVAKEVGITMIKYVAIGISLSLIGFIINYFSR